MKLSSGYIFGVPVHIMVWAGCLLMTELLLLVLLQGTAFRVAMAISFVPFGLWLTAILRRTGNGEV